MATNLNDTQYVLPTEKGMELMGPVGTAPQLMCLICGELVRNTPEAATVGSLRERLTADLAGAEEYEEECRKTYEACLEDYELAKAATARMKDLTSSFAETMTTFLSEEMITLGVKKGDVMDLAVL
jgi:hypothetical protein